MNCVFPLNLVDLWFNVPVPGTSSHKGLEMVWDLDSADCFPVLS